MLGLSSPYSADCFALARSSALAARIESFEAASASWMESNAVLRASTESVASFLEEIFAARAACSGEELVRDMLGGVYNATMCGCERYVAVVENTLPCVLLSQRRFAGSHENWPDETFA